MDIKERFVNEKDLNPNNLFVTSKNQTTNSPIQQFTSLKCCKLSFEAFKIKKMWLKILFKVKNKK